MRFIPDSEVPRFCAAINTKLAKINRLYESVGQDCIQLAKDRSPAELRRIVIVYLDTNLRSVYAYMRMAERGKDIDAEGVGPKFTHAARRKAIANNVDRGTLREMIRFARKHRVVTTTDVDRIYNLRHPRRSNGKWLSDGSIDGTQDRIHGYRVNKTRLPGRNGKSCIFETAFGPKGEMVSKVYGVRNGKVEVKISSPSRKERDAVYKKYAMS